MFPTEIGLAIDGSNDVNRRRFVVNKDAELVAPVSFMAVGNPGEHDAVALARRSEVPDRHSLLSIHADLLRF